MKDSNDQIVTPKATHHVVEGEYIDKTLADEPVENSDKKDKAKKKAEKTRTTRPGSSFSTFLYWLSAMIFAGGAAYVGFQALEKTNGLVTSAELNYAYEQQQMQIEIMANQLQQLASRQQSEGERFPGQEVFSELENLQQQINEQSLVIAELQSELQQTDGTPSSANKSAKQSSPKKPAETDESSVKQQQDLTQKLEQLEQRFLDLLANQADKEQELEELTAKFFNFSKDTNAKLKNYLESGEWETDKAELGEKMGQIENQLSEIAAQVSPKMEAVVEEIAPQLEGFLSIFNQFFQVKKHPMAEESEDK